MAFKFNPTTGKLDLVDIHENAISLTMDELKNLIDTSSLVPEQWYLVTDFQNKTQIANTTIETNTGSVEQIYLQASGTNTIYSKGHSKDRPDEEITFKQNPESLYQMLTGNYEEETNYGEFEISVTGSDTIQLDEDVINSSTYFYLYYSNYATGSYIELDLTGKDTLWFWDANTKTINIPQVYDFEGNLIDSDFTSADTYFYIESEFPVAFFPNGMIVARRNHRINFYVQGDYNSQLVRMYKIQADDWSAGTYSPSNIVRYNGVIWGCLYSTTDTPSLSSSNWIKIYDDDYILGESTYAGGLVSFYLPMDSSSYYDYPIFDVTQIDSITNKINVNVYNYLSSNSLSFVANQLSGWGNSNIYVNKTRILQQVSDTDGIIISSVISTVYRSKSTIETCFLTGGISNTLIIQGTSIIGTLLSNSTITRISGLFSRNSISNLTCYFGSGLILLNGATDNIIYSIQNVDFKKSFNYNTINKIYNCTFSDNCNNNHILGETSTTNFLGQWIRNKSLGRMYGTSNSSRQTFGYTADNFFGANVALNYFSVNTNIFNNAFMSSFSNNFTSAVPGHNSGRITNNTFIGSFTSTSGSGEFNIDNNFFSGVFRNVEFSNTAMARITDNVFSSDFSDYGQSVVFNNTAEYQVRYNNFGGVVYDVIFTRGSTSYNVFLGRIQDITFGGTTTQAFTYNTVGNQFVTNTIDANVTRCTLPQYWNGRAVTVAMTDRIILSDTENVGFGTDTPNANAIVDIVSTTKAFMPPRMTNTQMLAIATPTAGMMVYDSTNNKLCVYDGSSWQNCW